MKSKLIAVIAISLLACANLPNAQCSTLYGLSGELGFGAFGPDLYTIDQNTGAVTTIGKVGFSSVSNLASDWRPGSARLWAVDDRDNQLLRVDPLTGTGTAIGPLTAPGITAIAFDINTETMYAVSGSPYVSTPRQLYKVDVNTAATTLIGPTGLQDTGGLGVDLSGGLYATKFSSSVPSDVLVKLNAFTGAATPIGSTGVFAMVDFAARPEDGVMFGTATLNSNSLYRVNTTTGAASLVGPYPGSEIINGLAFLPDVPEPSTLLLIATAIAAFGTRRRRPTSHNRI